MFGGAVKVVLLAVVVYMVAHILLKLGVHRHYHKHHPGECRKVKGIEHGSEDFHVTKDGVVFITSGLSFSAITPSFKEFIKTNQINGRIMFLDLNKPDATARELKVKPTKNFDMETFRPHGLSVLEDEVKGEHLLYVVNHPDYDKPDRVEKFKYLPKTNELVHVKSFSSDQLTLTNDLTVVVEDNFYITNFLYFKNGLLNTLESLLLPVSFGSILFFNGSDFQQSVPGLKQPNGVLLSEDKRYLYLNLPEKECMEVYERKSDNSLTLTQTVSLYTMADNFHLSTSGDVLYTGTHPMAYKIMQYASDPTLDAPSSVLRIPLKGGKVVAEDITELFYDHGDLISASSVAAVYKNKLLIGSVIDTLVLCDANIKF